MEDFFQALLDARLATAEAHDDVAEARKIAYDIYDVVREAGYQIVWAGGKLLVRLI